jgi:predicted RNase H-like nuclease (RuvC/YqgF family)
MLVTELRGNLLEARAEAVQVGKLREELTICESRVAKLMAAASEAEVEGEGRLSSKQEVDELRAALQAKTRENRDLTISVRSLERKASEVKSIQSRLEACQEEVNRYKVRVEQSAPMLAEVARLRGASRAAVRSLQEQDKIIATLEENNKLLRAKVTELTDRTKTFENMEVALHESEAECSRLSDIVSTDIPLLKEKLKVCSVCVVLLLTDHYCTKHIILYFIVVIGFIINYSLCKKRGDS